MTCLSSCVNRCCLDINGSKWSTLVNLTSHGTKMYSQKRWILSRCTWEDKWSSGEISYTLHKSQQSHSINAWVFQSFTMEHFKSSHFHRWQTMQIVHPEKYCAYCYLYQQEAGLVGSSVWVIMFVDVLKLCPISNCKHGAVHTKQQPPRNCPC